jgi:endoglucanase
MTVPVFRSISSTAYASRTNTTVSVPAGVVDGDLLVAMFTLGGSGSTFTPPTGWTLLAGPTLATDNSFDIHTSLYWRVAASEPANYTFTHAALSSEAVIYAVSGASSAAPAVTTNSGQGTATTALGLTTATTAQLVFFAHNWALYGTAVPPGGTTPTFTERLNASNSLIYIADGAQASAGATGNKVQTNNLNGAGTDGWYGALVAFVAPATPPPPPTPAPSPPPSGAGPLRVASTNAKVGQSSYSFTYASGGTQTGVGTVTPLIEIGSGDRSNLIVSFDRYFKLGAQEVSPIGDETVSAVLINEARTIAVPLTFSGASTKLIHSGDADVHSDAILPSAFGLSVFAKGSKWHIKRVSTFSTSAAEICENGFDSNETGAQQFCFDPATFGLSNATTPGAFGNTGSSASYFGIGAQYVPTLLGNFVTGDPDTLGCVVDSIVAHGQSDPRGGYALRAAQDVTAGPLSFLNWARDGGDMTQVESNTRTAGMYKYAKIWIAEPGANDLIYSSLSRFQATESFTYAAMRAAGVQKIIRPPVLPRTSSSDQWRTSGGQTYAGGAWSTGGIVPQANAWFATLLSAGTIDNIPDFYTAVMDPADHLKWKTDGTTAYTQTSDGVHPSPWDGMGSSAMAAPVITYLNSISSTTPPPPSPPPPPAPPPPPPPTPTPPPTGPVPTKTYIYSADGLTATMGVAYNFAISTDLPPQAGVPIEITVSNYLNGGSVSGSPQTITSADAIAEFSAIWPTPGVKTLAFFNDRGLENSVNLQVRVIDPAAPPPGAGGVETPYATPAGTFTPRNYKGVNIAGGEDHIESVNPYGYDYIYPLNDELDYYAAKGFGLIRMPVTARRLQPFSYGALETIDTAAANAPTGGSLATIKNVIDHALALNMWVIIDPHDFGYFYDTTTSTARLIGADGEGTAQFSDFWTRIATKFKNYPNVIFGLINEPFNQTAAQWKTGAVAAINAIAAVTTSHLVLIPGTHYTDAASFATGQDNAAAWTGYTPPAGLQIAFELHRYLDSDNSGTHAACTVGRGSTMLQGATVWARAQGFKLFLGEFGWSQDATCPPEAATFVAYMTSNADVWKGWAYWNGGSRTRYGSYMFALQPADGVDKPQMAILLAQGNVGTPASPTPPPPTPSPPGTLPLKRITGTLVTQAGLPRANLVFDWAWFDESRPSLLTAPKDKGTLTTTTGGVFDLNVHSGLTSGQLGLFVLSNTNGTSAQSIAFAAPVPVI